MCLSVKVNRCAVIREWHGDANPQLQSNGLDGNVRERSASGCVEASLRWRVASDGA